MYTNPWQQSYPSTTTSGIGGPSRVLPAALTIRDQAGVNTISTLGDVKHLGEGNLAVVREGSTGRDEDNITSGQGDGFAAQGDSEQALGDLESGVTSESLVAAGAGRSGARVVADNSHGSLVAQLLGNDNRREGKVTRRLSGRDKRLHDLVKPGLVVEVLDAIILGHEVGRLLVGTQLVGVVALVPAGGLARGRVRAVDEVAGGRVVQHAVHVKGREGRNDGAVGRAALGVVGVSGGEGVGAECGGGVVGVGEGVEEIFEATGLDNSHHIGVTYMDVSVTHIFKMGVCF